MFYIPIIFVLISICLIFGTKNKYLRWPSIIIPPLFILPLIWISWDIVAIILWYPAIVAFIWSVISIIVRAIKTIIRHRKKLPAIKYQRTQFIRPILTIVVYLCVIGVVRLSIRSADDYGIKIAKQIQAQCKEQGICLNKIDGWVDVGENARAMSYIFYGKYGTKYFLRYYINDDKNEFTIDVKHNIDESFYIKGGVNKKLKATFSGYMHSKNIPID